MLRSWAGGDYFRVGGRDQIIETLKFMNAALTFDPLVVGEVESYTRRHEAYLTDYRIESRKLLWDVELSELK
jgi:hypothetical protein